ncbi:hypothetical protein ATANTOWER_031091 [Ataeniobius toweri]|uniref:Uncharacterized protein n=1 Tax=Ataeniobius toweri TaxID=208326 RepID=A0ABU7BND0_9TELE|nr:hypothetical protein [Ataeniobius toweri]
MSKPSNQAGIADLCLSSGLQKFAAQNCLLFVRRMESPRVSLRRPFAFFHALCLSCHCIFSLECLSED